MITQERDTSTSLASFLQPRPQGFSLKKWVGREKALASASLVCYTAVFSVVTQSSSPQGALRDDTKNGCVADYGWSRIQPKYS